MAVSPDIMTTRLAITPFTEKHISDAYIAWLNDKELTRYSAQRFTTHDRDSCLAYWQSFQDSPNYFWAIEESVRDRLHIGNINAYVDSRHGVADIGILIGDSGAQNRGYATEAIRAVMDYLFDQAGFRKITMGTIANNSAMLKVMEKLGMVDDGVRRGHQLFEGQPVDVVHRALFRLA